MKKLGMQTTHRKCFVCGHITTDLSKDKCPCGGYLHMVGQIYSPKVVRGKDK